MRLLRIGTHHSAPPSQQLFSLAHVVGGSLVAQHNNAALFTLSSLGLDVSIRCCCGADDCDERRHGLGDAPPSSEGVVWLHSWPIH